MKQTDVLIKLRNLPDDTKKYIDNKVAELVDSAPETLDTLNELATSLGNDPNFATTTATALGKKLIKLMAKH